MAVGFGGDWNVNGLFFDSVGIDLFTDKVIFFRGVGSNHQSVTYWFDKGIFPSTSSPYVHYIQVLG